MKRNAESPALSMNNVYPETACVGLSAGAREEKKNGSKDPPLQEGHGPPAGRTARVCVGQAERRWPRRGKNGSKDPPLQEGPRLRGFPWGGPGGAGGSTVDPVDGLGAGVRKFVGMIAEAFADGIPPNVAGDILYLIGGPKNVVVVTRFPESAAVGLAKLEGCALFEEADEFEQVAAIMRTLDKNMKVIGHQTVGMKPVGTADGAFEQQ